MIQIVETMSPASKILPVPVAIENLSKNPIPTIRLIITRIICAVCLGAFLAIEEVAGSVSDIEMMGLFRRVKCSKAYDVNIPMRLKRRPGKNSCDHETCVTCITKRMIIAPGAQKRARVYPRIMAVAKKRWYCETLFLSALLKSETITGTVPKSKKLAKRLVTSIAKR